MRPANQADVWWRNATVYCLDVETFQDSNGDGIGDFRGLTSRIDHLARLGVTCLWLMPFYPSPNRDDGYDVADYYSVDPRLGTLGDFVEMMRTARHHGIRVIADLVVNHTSDQHPWFQESRSSLDNPKRDWYVWRDEPPEGAPQAVIFPDEEDSLWRRDEATGQYYLHHFYRHQPDLNISNPDVRDEIARVMGFWMELGLSGFRVDAVPYLLTTGHTQGADVETDPHSYMRALSSFMTRRSGDAIMLGEVNVPYDELMRFFGDGGDELDLSFDFPGMQAMYLALARRDAGPLRDAMVSRPLAPRDTRWATFVRNHDELTLDQLSPEQRDEVFAAFGPEPDMQVFGRGLRRRLPSMFGGDQDRIRMVYSLLFSLPGTPVLFYGEEIGMVENLDVPGRSSVRTPMQWEPGPTGGFTTADVDQMRRPMPARPFGPDHISVEAQRGDPDSLLTAMSRLADLRREMPHFGWGDVEWLESDAPSVLAHRAELDGESVIAVHHLGEAPLEVTLTTGLEPGTRVRDQLASGAGVAEPVEVAADGTLTLTLGRYAARWLRQVS
ncbi:alpha-amylase family protein [Demequina sp. EGI L300058]|uniref:Alpha-amylase n=1 Tax=Demequina muriae TaxID=3051664 RepID=A0ABT8GHA5_9MICO|nr:alpha-amylase family protein [Demequina sp. EGI L300058]MDN4480651.1 alpha-amylase family protein [Demequina sp. EGI L300058]